MRGYWTESLKLTHLLTGILGLFFVILCSVNSQANFRLGAFEFSQSMIEAEMTAQEKRQMDLGLLIISPLTTCGVTIDMPLQDMTGAALPIVLEGAGELAGGTPGGMFGKGIGDLTAGLIGTDYRIQSSWIAGVAGLVLAMLLAILLRKDSRAAFWQIPYSLILGLVYLMLLNHQIASAISSAQLQMQQSPDQLSQTLAPLAGIIQFSFEYYPFVLNLLLYLVIAAIIARTLALLISLKLGYEIADLPAGGFSLAYVFSGIFQPDQAVVNASRTRPEPLADEDSGLKDKLVKLAVVCPFCGNTRMPRNIPKVCSVCSSRLRGRVESFEAPTCPDCENRLLKNAHFCHHCGLNLSMR